MALNSNELNKIHQRALNRAQQQQQTRATTAPSGDQLTDWQGLKQVSRNVLPWSAAHQKMKFEPQE